MVCVQISNQTKERLQHDINTLFATIIDKFDDIQSASTYVFFFVSAPVWRTGQNINVCKPFGLIRNVALTYF